MHKVSALLRFSWKLHYVFVVVQRQPIGAPTDTLVSVQKTLSSVHDGEPLLLTMGRFAVLNRGFAGTTEAVCGNAKSRTLLNADAAGKGISGPHRHPLQSRLTGGGFRTGPGTANASVPHPPGGPCQRGTPFRSDARGHKLAGGHRSFHTEDCRQRPGGDGGGPPQPEITRPSRNSGTRVSSWGNVDIEGKDGKGTTLTLSIPHRLRAKP